MESRWRWIPQCYLNVHANCAGSCCLIISQRCRRIRMQLWTSWFHTLGKDPDSVILSLFKLFTASVRTVLSVRNQRVKLRCQAVWAACVSYAGSFLGTPALLNLIPLQGGELVSLGVTIPTWGGDISISHCQTLWALCFLGLSSFRVALSRGRGMASPILAIIYNLPNRIVYHFISPMHRIIVLQTLLVDRKYATGTGSSPAGILSRGWGHFLHQRLRPPAATAPKTQALVLLQRLQLKLCVDLGKRAGTSFWGSTSQEVLKDYLTLFFFLLLFPHGVIPGKKLSHPGVWSEVGLRKHYYKQS